MRPRGRVRDAKPDARGPGPALVAQRLRAVNKNLVGAVLNNVDLSRAYDKDYYYANYYYEDAEGSAPKKRRSTPATKVG